MTTEERFQALESQIKLLASAIQLLHETQRIHDCKFEALHDVAINLMEHVSLFSVTLYPDGCPICSNDEEELN